MDCPGCADRIARAVRAQTGVHSAQVDFLGKRMDVRFAADVVEEATLRDHVRQLGYEALPLHVADGRVDAVGAAPRGGGVALAATALASALWLAGVAAAVAAQPTAARWLYALAMAFGGYVIAAGTWQALRRRTVDFCVLMAVAVVGAVAIGEWREAATVVVLFAVAELLESYAVDRARNAIRSLMELAPREVTVRRDGVLQRIPVEEARIGERAVVRPGERIPLDGLVRGGETAVNEAPVTGESRLVEKHAGDPVYAGSVNDTGVLEFEVTQHVGDTMLARIIHLVERAQSTRAASQRLVDRFARYYTPGVVALAALVTAVPTILFAQPFEPWFYRSLVFLVVSCPCALVISTPVSVLSGLGRAARSGVLIKGGVHLENLGRVRAVAFDKTGTLTQGVPRVSDVIPLAAGITPEMVLRVAARLESGSEHAIARAIVQEAADKGWHFDTAPSDFVALPGMGARGVVDGRTYMIGTRRLCAAAGLAWQPHAGTLDALEDERRTVVLLADEARVLGCIALGDELRSEGPDAVRALRRLGVVETALLTGDHPRVAEAIARKVGVDACHAGLLPEAKVAHVERLCAQYGVAAMVGDGINDAPALAAATVGIAIGGTGTDAALEAADVTLLSGDLSRVPAAIRAGKRTARTIRENIAIALGVKGVVLVLALFGVAKLWMGVGADVGTALVVVLNSVRLLHARLGYGDDR
jgi:Cd2+/Zn2+-exporting ATPase